MRAEAAAAPARAVASSAGAAVDPAAAPVERPHGLPRHVAIYLSARCHGSREATFLALVRYLLDAGCRVDVVVAGMPPWLDAELDANFGSRAGRVDLYAAPGLAALRRLPHLLRAYASAPLLAAWLRRQRPEMLFGTSIPPNLACLGARSLAGTDTAVVVRQSNVLRIDGHERYGAVRRRLRDPLIPRLYRRAEGVIAVSAGVADNLRALRAAPSGRIAVIPNGVDAGRLQRLAQEPAAVHPWLRAATPRRPVAVAVGRLQAKKDYGLLLDALARVRQQHPLRLVIFGEGPERRRLEARIQALGLQQAVALAGFHPNPWASLARAQLYVLSSISEGMPSAPIEALCLGVPVVCTDCPSGPAEILDSGRYGALVPMRDAEALARAMGASLDQDTDRERLRRRGASFATAATAERYAAALAAGLAARRQRPS